MKNRIVFFLSLCLFLSITNSYGQRETHFSTSYVMGGGEASLLQEAEWFYGIGDFRRALALFLKLDMRYPGAKGYKYYAGICYLQKTDEQEKAIGYLEAAYSGNPKLPDILFYLGRSYMVNYRFDEAIGYFKLAEGKKKTSPENRVRIPRLIEQCMNAKALRNQRNEQKFVIENLGAPVNTEYHEHIPLVSADESVIIFTYNGKRSKGGLINIYGEPDPDGQYFQDIFVAHRMDNEWLEPDALGPTINSTYHDASVALSPDGHSLFISKDEEGGDIYISQHVKNKWGAPEPLMGEVNTKNYEAHVSITVNGQVLFFISDRPGGLGGQDIYQATLKDDNTWGNIVNLGPDINTPYNEDAPFIHANGELLYFSSEGHNSMGGYDVFYSTFKNSQWSKPNNLGPPVNTPNDDNFYVVAPSGERGYFSSGRAGGYGGSDIYMVKPGVYGKLPNLALLKGRVQNNGRNVKASIKVTNTTTNESYLTNTSDVTSDNYLISLTPGHAYEMDFILKGNKLHTEKVDVSNLNVFVEVRQDIELSERRNPFIDSTNIIQTQLDKNIAKIDVASQDASLERMIQDSIATDSEEPLATMPADTTAPPLNKQVQEAARLGKVANDSLTRVEEEARLAVEETALLEAMKEARRMDTQDSADGAREEARIKAEVEANLQAEQTRLTAVQDSLSRAEEEDRVIVENTERERVQKERVIKEEEARLVAVQDSLSRAEEEARRTADETAKLEVAAIVTTQAAARKQEEIVTTEAPDQGEKDRLNFNNILFDFDKATLRNESKIELDAVRTYLTQYSMAKIIIGGHADAIGTENYNMLLSERRAQKAAAYLIDRGINESQLVLYAFGKSKPIEPNTNSDGTDNPVARQKNRRVELSDTQASQDLAGGKMIAFSKRVANQTKQISRFATRSGTFYTVQVAAYKYPKNYVHTRLDELGKAKTLDVDGITRFTIGRFDKLKEARQFKKLVVEMGTSDAFITAEVDGERRYLNKIYTNGGMASRNSIQSISPAAKVAYKRVMDKYGTERAEGLKFNVQISAYTHTENYSAETLKTHEGVKPQRVKETFIPFTIGSFETLLEAEKFKKSVADSGVNNSFITAKHNGQKVLIRDLIDNNFYTL